jgi:C4-dicarboxylate transporter, DctM subunit
MFVDGVAMVLLTVPVVFPVAHALKIDPVHLGIMLTLAVEMSVVTPPVGLNLFAVSGTSKIPVTQVLKGTVIRSSSATSRCCLLVIFFPALAHLAAGVSRSPAEKLTSQGLLAFPGTAHPSRDRA